MEFEDCGKIVGEERVVGLLKKSERSEIYDEAKQIAEELRVPVIEEECRIEESIENFKSFSAELHFIKGNPEGVNGGLEGLFHYFVLPSKSYVEQDYIKRIMAQNK